MNIDERKKEILEVNERRFACRDFDESKEVSEEDMNFILEIGNMTPSSFGLDPWKFLVIENEDLKDKIYKTVPRLEKRIKTADQLVVILTRNSSELRYSSNYVNEVLTDVKGYPPKKVKGIKEGLRQLQQRESSSIYDMMSIYNWSWRQSYLALGNMMNAAASIGIDTCPIEEFHEKELEKILVDAGALDTDKFSISVLLVLGYRANDPIDESKRKPIEQVVERIK